MTLSRGTLLETLVSMATCGNVVLNATADAQDAEVAKSPFRYRGYYTIGTRFPTAGLAVWKKIINAMHADNCNLLIHWIPGCFRSVKFPETWACNTEHENIKHDFTKDFIDYAHARKCRMGLIVGRQFKV
jgi:hypothetical protein